jgi:hypothetical protein
MAIRAAADFAAFYDHTAPMMSDAGTLLVITVTIAAINGRL